ncbi:hypothetical protein [Microvirga pudoricolor]|uniref:hypothetical protein n=1 Tax=Microvirga pudoricolor TaxID=2778729 RepID=UPI00194EA1FA|nr:hypothetical protein [Microvirga pudoricolor]MBM6595684.1 hypothetical protein [Microvirga pudoricolor]
MSSANVARAIYSTRKAANQAARRLVDSGFARNSIDIHELEDDGFELSVHARRENLWKARRVIGASTPREYATGAYEGVRAHPAVALGIGLLAGLSLYAILSRTSRE